MHVSSDHLDEAVAQAFMDRALPNGRRVVCPFCSHERTRRNQSKPEMTLTRDQSNGMVLYACHHCDRNGWVKEKDEPVRKYTPREPAIEIIDTAMRQVDTGELNSSAVEWLSQRGISLETATRYQCFSSVTWFRDAGGETASIGLPFVNQSVVYAAKMRALGSKSFTCTGKPQTAFGSQFLTEGCNIIITEGEPDALVYAEVKPENCVPVSVPHGAPDPHAKRKEGDDDKRYAFMWGLNDFITKAEVVYIATDNDPAGDMLAEELARRVGKWKCRRVLYNGSKDANEQLLKEGKEAVLAGLKSAEPWPVEGLYEAGEWEEEYVRLYEEGLPVGVSTRYPSLNSLFRMVPGFVAVVTGVPSSGKSELLDQLMVDWAKDNGWRFAVWSPENPPKYHLPKLASKLSCKPFFHGHGTRMTPTERDGALSWIRRHFYFLHDDNGELSSLDSIIERIRIAVLRYGINAAVIDPYNYISAEGDTETKWVNDMLTKLKVLAKSHDIALFIVAHPTKLIYDKEGKIKPPLGYDISGSANWYNKTDYGITVHRDIRTTPTISKIILWKLKFNWMGDPGDVELTYNTSTMSYEEISYAGPEWELKDKPPIMDERWDNV